MTQRLDPSLVRHGRVNGRYFRENFAQGGIDLVQIIPELVTNADSAIAVGGRGRGRIGLSFGSPDPEFAAEWRKAMRRLRAPALLDSRHEVRCADDGVGTEYDANLSRAVLEACVTACRTCGDECESHAEHGMEHCAVCAEQCRRCEEACRRLADAMA